MNSRKVLLLAGLTCLLAASPHFSVAGEAPAAALPDNDAQAKARSLLEGEQPQNAAPATQATNKPAPVPETTQKTAVPAEPAPEPAPLSTEALPAGPRPDNAAQAEARATLNAAYGTAAAKTMTQSESQPVFAAPEATPQESANPKSPWTTGMESPALPTTSTQQQQLDELLALYRADRISAAEYHSRRAEILANK